MPRIWVGFKDKLAQARKPELDLTPATPMIVLAKCIARCFLVGGAAALAGCASYERLALYKESKFVARVSTAE